MVKGAKKKKTWSDYSNAEIQQIKKERCANCPYNGRTQADVRSGYNLYCNYIEIVGHSRGCLPDRCEHYKDSKEDVAKMIKENKTLAHYRVCFGPNSNTLEVNK